MKSYHLMFMLCIIQVEFGYTQKIITNSEANYLILILFVTSFIFDLLIAILRKLKKG